MHKMKYDTTKPNESNADKTDHSEFDEQDGTDEEFATLNNQIDQLNCALDILERKNDDIQAQLHALLQSSREVRNQMQRGVVPKAP